MPLFILEMVVLSVKDRICLQLTLDNNTRDNRFLSREIRISDIFRRIERGCILQLIQMWIFKYLETKELVYSEKYKRDTTISWMNSTLNIIIQVNAAYCIIILLVTFQTGSHNRPTRPFTGGLLIWDRFHALPFPADLSIENPRCLYHYYRHFWSSFISSHW